MNKKSGRAKGSGGACSLCHRHRPLCDSHVIPEFMYAPLYDETHRINFVAADGSERDAVIQKGLRERLLCAKCEAKFSKWEHHVAPRWRRATQEIRGQRAGVIVNIPARYPDLKLFLLSLFWRASRAEHPNFSAVRLGAEEALIREMLLSETPGPVTAYPSLAFAYSGISLLTGSIGLAGGGQAYGMRAFRLSISGVQWFFFASADVNDAALNQLLAVTHRGLTIGIGNIHESVELRRITDIVYR